MSEQADTEKNEILWQLLKDAYFAVVNRYFRAAEIDEDTASKIVRLKVFLAETALPTAGHEYEPKSPRTSRLRSLAELILQISEEEPMDFQREFEQFLDSSEERGKIYDENKTMSKEGEEISSLREKMQDIRILHSIPEGIETGLEYTTPAELAESDLTSYSYNHIVKLARDGEIDAYQIGKQIILTANAVEQIRERERESAAGRLFERGRKPGQRERRPPRSTPS